LGRRSPFIIAYAESRAFWRVQTKEAYSTTHCFCCRVLAVPSLASLVSTRKPSCR